MKIIPPYQITSEILNLINEAEEYIILVSPYVNFTKWERMRIDIMNAVKRGIRVVFYTRMDNENSKSWEQIEDLGLTPKLIKNLHAKLYFNEKSGIVTSMNLLTSSHLNALEFGSIYNTDEELKELKSFVKKFLEPSVEVEKPTDEDLYIAKEKFIVLTQHFLSNNLRRSVYCQYNNNNINFNVNNQYSAYLDKISKIFVVSGIISGFESDNFDFFKKNFNMKNVKVELYQSSIAVEYNNKLSSSNFDYLTVMEKKEMLDIILGFVIKLSTFKEYCYQLKKNKK